MRNSTICFFCVDKLLWGYHMSYAKSHSKYYKNKANSSINYSYQTRIFLPIIK